MPPSTVSNFNIKIFLLRLWLLAKLSFFVILSILYLLIIPFLFMPSFRTYQPPKPLNNGKKRPNSKKRILILTASVGSGHTAVANLLASCLLEQCTLSGGKGIEVEVTIRDYLDALPWFIKGIFKLHEQGMKASPAFLNWMFGALEKDHGSWVQDLTTLLCRGAQTQILLWGNDFDGYGNGEWEKVDMVISTFSDASQALGRLKRAGLLHVPAVTMVTEMAVHRHWVDPAVDLHLCFIGDALGEGTKEEGILWGVQFQAVRLLVGDGFERCRDGETGVRMRKRMRKELRIEEGEVVVLVNGGSLGAGSVEECADALLTYNARADRRSEVGNQRVVVLCSHNEELRKRLRGKEGLIHLVFREDMPNFLAMADILVVNAGGMSFMEGYVAGIPMIMYEPLAGGRASARLLEKAEIVPWPKDENELAKQVLRLIDMRKASEVAYSHKAGDIDVVSVILELMVES